LLQPVATACGRSHDRGHTRRRLLRASFPLFLRLSVSPCLRVSVVSLRPVPFAFSFFRAFVQNTGIRFLPGHTRGSWVLLISLPQRRQSRLRRWSRDRLRSRSTLSRSRRRRSYSCW